MPAIPILDGAAWTVGGAARKKFERDLFAACSENGCFYLERSGIPFELSDAMLQAADAFFQLPEADKQQIHIRRSSNFRGYSQMKNARDWREQLHVGEEGTAGPPGPDYQKLSGENLWPPALEPHFRQTTRAYLEAAGKLGRRLLSILAQNLELDGHYFDRLSTRNPYNLLKLICYYPQAEALEKSGVAPHCDWSWLTLLLQDETGGLEVLSRSGIWQKVTPRPQTLFINVGELLEILTKGYFRATPHRVVNPSVRQRRLSVPVFINPALDAVVQPLDLSPVYTIKPDRIEPGHIHRVTRPDLRFAPFVFGDSEWRRKGLGVWCYDEKCLNA